jgi:hypothetical protein
LENGTYYILYGVRSAGSMLVAGFAQGAGTSNNGSFSSSNLKDFYYTGAVLSGSVSATYVTNNTLTGSVTESTTTTTFTASPPASTAYIYNTGANLSNITGAWTLSDLLGGTLNMSVASNGTVTGSEGSCTFSGTITPRASGKNVFDISLTFGAAPCLLPNQTATGIAIDYLLANGTRQFIVAGTNTSRTVGSSFFGTR